MADDLITLTRTEYQDLADARDHAIAMRDIATGAMETLSGAEVDAYLAAPTPLAFWRMHRGLTQAELATKADVALHSLAEAEAAVSSLGVDHLVKAARVLRVRMEDLVAEQ